MIVLKRVMLSMGLAAGLTYGFAAISADEGKATDTKATATKPADPKAPGSGPNPYTDCGIGAALFPNTHWAAATSNVIFDLGITAITSATSRRSRSATTSRSGPATAPTLTGSSRPGRSGEIGRASCRERVCLAV